MARHDTNPLGYNLLAPVREDVERYRHCLVKDSWRLFSSHENRLDVFRSLSANGEVETHCSEGIDALNLHIQINRSSARDCFYLISQQFTWGPFRISQLALQTLLASHRVFIAFLDLLPIYGLRIHDDQHTWSGFRSSLPTQQSVENGDIMYECCYSLRYVEENGRSAGDPWSLRQTAVYHQFHQEDGRSCWIILQIATGMRIRLKQALSDKRYRNRRDGVDSVRLHVDFLSAMASNWARYLEYLHAQLAKLDEKAFHSRVGSSAPADYIVTFEDCQQLQLLRQKLLRTSSTLDACLDTARGCAEHCRSLIALDLTTLGEQAVAEIAAHIHQIGGYRRSVRQIIEQSLGTSKLLFKILEFRSDATLAEKNSAMHHTLDLLREISARSAQDSVVAVDLARQGQRDSKLLKALSTVATIYLPASLTATIFSSSLIQSKPNGADDSTHGTHIVVSSQFWVFIVISICLTILTLACTLTLKQRGLWCLL